MDLQETLLSFGEFLDGQGLIVSDTKGDDRSHDQLARDFIEQWESESTLMGR